VRRAGAKGGQRVGADAAADLDDDVARPHVAGDRVQHGRDPGAIFQQGDVVFDGRHQDSRRPWRAKWERDFSTSRLSASSSGPPGPSASRSSSMIVAVERRPSRLFQMKAALGLRTYIFSATGSKRTPPSLTSWYRNPSRRRGGGAEASP